MYKQSLNQYKNDYINKNNIYGNDISLKNKVSSSKIDYSRPPSEEDLRDAQQSLKLLKSKMKRTKESFNSSQQQNYNNHNPSKVSCTNQKDSLNKKNNNQFQGCEDYKEKNAYSQKLSMQDRLDCQVQGQNQNYRKVFNPFPNQKNDFNSIRQEGEGNSCKNQSSVQDTRVNKQNQANIAIKMDQKAVKLYQDINEQDEQQRNNLKNRKIQGKIDQISHNSQQSQTQNNIIHTKSTRREENFEQDISEKFNYIQKNQNTYKNYKFNENVLNENSLYSNVGNLGKYQTNQIKRSTNLEQDFVRQNEAKVGSKNKASQDFLQEMAKLQPGDDQIQLIQCPQGCGRSFNEVALEKHQKICKKVFQQKRKSFNTQAQRILNSEHLQLLKYTKSYSKNNNYERKAPQKSSKWKQQSQAFRAILKQNSGQILSKETQKLLEENHQQEYEDYVQCEGCGRKFNQKAAEKHIPFCKNKAKNELIKKKHNKKF